MPSLEELDYLRAGKPRSLPGEEASTQYEPVDALAATVRTTAIMGGAGALLSGVQNSLARQNIGAMGIFTRTGGTIATFAAIGAGYAFASSAAANLRQKNDSLNHAIGGFVGGSLLGVTYRRMPPVIGYGTGLAVLMFAYSFTGGEITGYWKDPETDEYERHEKLRKNRRRPIEETLAELGEGRGIYGPGYEERRRQRIKERYGVDVPVGPQPAGANGEGFVNASR